MAKKKQQDIKRMLESECGPRKVLYETIVSNVKMEKMSEAIDRNKMERYDAIEKVVKDAVRVTPLVSFSGIPHVFDPSEGIYVKFDYHEFGLALYDVMRACLVPDGCYSAIQKTIKICWSECQSRKIEVDNSVVVMNNGVYDTLDCKIHPFSATYATNMKVRYRYNEFEHAARWKRFLDEVLPEKGLQLLLQEFVAAAYIDRSIAKFEYMCILYGHGANGKSVVFETIQGLLGEDNISNFSIADLIGGNREQNIAMCNGMRMNYCSEIRTREIGDKNADAFKSLVSGEAQMARSLYREPFRATEIPIIMANANKLPKLEDASYAMKRRIVIIPFETTIKEEEQDLELAATLRMELPGIFNWMLDGLKSLRANNYQLHIPPKVRKLVNDYVNENNAVLQWTEDSNMFSCWHPNTENNPTWKTNRELFEDFTHWCDDNGYERRLLRDFIQEMKDMEYKMSRRCHGNGFSYYHAPTVEEIRALNMEIAIGMQGQQYIQMLREKASSYSRITVEGTEDLERYLGFPKDCIWPYVKSGQLDGAYKKDKGRMLFDVEIVQSKLAEAGFYAELKSNTNSCKRRATNVLKGMRQSFNSQMRSMGIPIRKYGNVYGYVPTRDKDCFVVPDDWEYSKKAAEIVLSQRKENLVKLNKIED